ncbi:MAG: 30S ribosomal protein S9, partial [Candidatus Brocadiales bacterium]
ATSLGVARALYKSDETLAESLRSAKLLTRDSRMKERKKYGQKGARKKFQWTKR